MIDALFILAWLAIGYPAGRAAYDDLGSPGFAVCINCMGPLGLVIALVCNPGYFMSSRSSTKLGHVLDRFYGDRR